MKKIKKLITSTLVAFAGIITLTSSAHAESVEMPDIRINFTTADQKPLANRHLTLLIMSTKVSFFTADGVPTSPHRVNYTPVTKLLGYSSAKGQLVVPQNDISLGLGHPLVSIELFSNDGMGSQETGCRDQVVDLNLQHLTSNGMVPGCSFQFLKPSEIPSELHCESLLSELEIAEKLAQIRKTCKWPAE